MPSPFRLLRLSGDVTMRCRHCGAGGEVCPDCGCRSACHLEGMGGGRVCPLPRIGMEPTAADHASPLFGWTRFRLMTLGETSTVSGTCDAMVECRKRDCDGERCSDLLCGRPNTHWSRHRNPQAEDDRHWRQSCDRHSLLGEDADAVVANGKVLSEEEPEHCPAGMPAHAA